MQLFIPFYILIVLSILLTQCKLHKLSNSSVNLLIISILLIFFISVGSRPFDFQGDTGTYLWMFQSISNGLYDGSRLEIGFLWLLKGLTFLDLTERGFLVFISAFQSILWFSLIKYSFSGCNKKLVISTLLIVSSFFVYNLGGNVLRQGIAIPIALLSIQFLIRKRILWSIIFSLIAMSFHKTSIVMILSYFTAQTLNFKLRYFFILFFSLTLLSFLGLFDLLIPLLPSFHSGYQHLFTESAYEIYRVGFRFDFWLFSLPPLLFYFFLDKEARWKYEIIIKSYIILFSIFIVLFTFPYSDRFGLYLWCYMLLILPMFFYSYTFQLGNSFLVYIFIISLLGVFSFIYNPLMKFGYNFNLLF